MRLTIILYSWCKYKTTVFSLIIIIFVTTGMHGKKTAQQIALPRAEATMCSLTCGSETTVAIEMDARSYRVQHTHMIRKHCWRWFLGDSCLRRDETKNRRQQEHLGFLHGQWGGWREHISSCLVLGCSSSHGLWFPKMLESNVILLEFQQKLDCLALAEFALWH